MLTGRIPFRGETVSDTLANILQSSPEWEKLPETTPANIKVLMRRCMEKDQQRRLYSMVDVVIEIKETMQLPKIAPPVTSSAEFIPVPTSKRRRIAMMIAAIIIIALTAITVRFIPERRIQPPSVPIGPVVELGFEFPEDVSMFVSGSGAMAISPDGTHIAFVGRKAGVKQLYLRRLNRLRPLDRLEVTAVKDTEGAKTVFFSHDSQWLGYATETRLWRVPLIGGQTIPICDVTGVTSAFWAEDNWIFFASTEYMVLARVEALALGGEPEPVSRREGPLELWHLDPEVLPGGKAIIFGTGDGSSIAGFQNIVVQSLVTEEREILLPGAGFPRYAASGHLVYESGGVLRAAPFDKDTRTLGPAVSIPGVSNRARFSRRGRLAWAPYVPQTEMKLLWVDRQGNETEVTDKRREYFGPRISPADENYIAFWLGGGGTEAHVWILDRRSGMMNQLTTTGSNWWCYWSPDGNQIAYISQRSEESAELANLYRRTADGSGEAEQLTEGPFYDQPTSWTRYGIIIQRSFDPQTGWDVMLVPPDGDRKLEPLLNSPANESRGELSPDGRWLAYVSSTETEPPGVFVQPFPGPGRKRRISPEGIFAGDPIWSPDGRELFYRDLDAEKFMVVDVKAGDEFDPNTPRVLFDDCYIEHSPYGRTYDIHPDGQSFVMVKKETTNPPPRRITIRLNWFEELKRLVPIDKH